MKIVQQRSRFDTSPEEFRDEYEKTQISLRNRVLAAQVQLSQVELADIFRVRISQLCSELDVDGLRGDIVINRAVRAIAAFEYRSKVIMDDVRRVASLCLCHRIRKDPLETIDIGGSVDEAV